MISRRAALSMFGRAALSFAAGVTLAASDAEARGPGSPHPYATMLGRGRVRAGSPGADYFRRHRRRVGPTYLSGSRVKNIKGGHPGADVFRSN